jgi:hypothetical protein
MAENLELNLTVQAWADIVIRIWLDKIAQLKINYSYQLADSFVNHIISHANGNVQMIEFAFNYYGKFVDMGVGRGVTLEDVGSPGINRKPKPWYSRTFYSEVQKLVKIMAEKYARKGAMAIVENVDDNALKWTPQNI